MFGEKLCCHFKFTLKKVIISPRFIIYDIYVMIFSIIKLKM